MPLCWEAFCDPAALRLKQRDFNSPRTLTTTRRKLQSVYHLRLAPVMILVQKAYYDTLIEFRGQLGKQAVFITLKSSRFDRNLSSSICKIPHCTAGNASPRCWNEVEAGTTQHWQLHEFVLAVTHKVQMGIRWCCAYSKEEWDSAWHLGMGGVAAYIGPTCKNVQRGRFCMPRSGFSGSQTAERGLVVDLEVAKGNQERGGKLKRVAREVWKQDEIRDWPWFWWKIENLPPCI